MAQLDAGTITFQKETISNDHLLQELIKPFEIALELKNLKINKNYQMIIFTILIFIGQ